MTQLTLMNYIYNFVDPLESEKQGYFAKQERSYKVYNNHLSNPQLSKTEMTYKLLMGDLESLCIAFSQPGSGGDFGISRLEPISE